MAGSSRGRTVWLDGGRKHRRSAGGLAGDVLGSVLVLAAGRPSASTQEDAHQRSGGSLVGGRWCSGGAKGECLVGRLFGCFASSKEEKKTRKDEAFGRYGTGITVFVTRVPRRACGLS